MDIFDDMTVSKSFNMSLATTFTKVLLVHAGKLKFLFILGGR